MKFIRAKQPNFKIHPNSFRRLPTCSLAHARQDHILTLFHHGTTTTSPKLFKVCTTIQTKLWWCNISFYKYHVFNVCPSSVKWCNECTVMFRTWQLLRIIAIHIGFSVFIWGAKLNFTFYSPTDWQWWTPVEDYCYPSQNADQKK